MEPIGLIVGTGMQELMALESAELVAVETKAGTVSVIKGRLEGRPVALLKRHGEGHKVPPHRINFEANILALKELGITRCFSTSAVGSMRDDWNTGTLAVLSDFIDFTRRGVTTLYHNEIRHADFSEPFCGALRKSLIKSATSLSRYPQPEAVYLCVDGPRYETPAEVRLYRQWGADVAGMTVATEAILAREAGICYATMAVITNLGTGLAHARLNHLEVEEAMNAAKEFLSQLFRTAIRNLPAENECPSRIQWSGN